MSRHAWLWTVIGVVAAVAIVIVGGLSGHIRRDDPDVVNCAEVKCVALTFDDGPSPYTDRLLKVLQDSDAKATFFLIGNKVAANPEGAKRIAEAGMPKAVEAKAKNEFNKLKQMSPMSAEATVVRNWLDVLLSLPWGKSSRVKRDIVEAQKVLDADHYGLEKVKDRIVEYLAVQARTNKLKGPILCLVGPPGVGKTSLGKSIAKATGREFVRQSLGGVRDEAEIRGHRRTYVGALPSRIVRAVKEAGSMNPVVLLDEVDKVGSDFRGDPAAALLEVLADEARSADRDGFLDEGACMLRRLRDEGTLVGTRPGTAA